jgi:branched-chain amino acid transport system ATP-binding protein
MSTPSAPNGSNPPLLDVQGLCSGYGASPVLFDVSLQLGRGEILGLIGRNGMGKTTLVRTIMGLTRRSSGVVSIAGQATAALPTHRIARLGLALVPEGRQVFANLTVEEHLSAFERPSPDGQIQWHVASVFDLFPRLAERRHHLGNQLSGGEQQMLAIGRALVTNPKLLILDEATEGLSPLVREEIWRALRTLRKAGHAMIVIDKYVQRLIGVADHHVVLEKGRVVWRGSSDQLNADRSVWQRYLGV